MKIVNENNEYECYKNALYFMAGLVSYAVLSFILDSYKVVEMLGKF